MRDKKSSGVSAMLSLVVLFFGAISSHAQEITIAAAADLRPALDEMAKQFEPAAKIHLHVIYGSSGDLYHQIQNGAPFDLFLSANADYPRKLEESGAAVAGTYYEYAHGKIVLVVNSSSKLDITRGLSALLDPSVKKIAIADPTHAPYGVAAVAALKSEKLYDSVSPKLVTGENVSQAASFVLSGAADAGIVALSLVIAPPARSQVRFVGIPADKYSPIVQACVIVKSSKNPEAAAKFETYLKSDDAAKILERFGFELPTHKSVK